MSNNISFILIAIILSAFHMQTTYFLVDTKRDLTRLVLDTKQECSYKVKEISDEQ